MGGGDYTNPVTGPAQQEFELDEGWEATSSPLMEVLLGIQALKA